MNGEEMSAQDVSQQGLPRGMAQNDVNHNLTAALSLTERTKHPSQKTQNGGDVFQAPIQSGDVPAQRFDPPQASSRAMFEEEEVTQHCPVAGCLYTSFKSVNPADFKLCLEQIKMHLLGFHGLSIDGGSGQQSTSIRPEKTSEYIAATRPRTVLKVTDDAVNNLSEARFFATPLNLQVMASNMPAKIEPVNTIVDLSHVGMAVINREILRKVQDRTNTGIKLRDFMADNMRNVHTEDEEMSIVKSSNKALTFGKTYTNLGTPKDCILALIKFANVWNNFHVLDYSPRALLKLAMEKYRKAKFWV